MFVIAGLGNPGAQYERTRHNVGFDLIDYLAAQYRITINKTKHRALIGDGIIQGQKVMLVKPQTFMNVSGESLQEILHFYKVPVSQLIVAYDDVDLAVGRLRVRPKGSAGTHNGMRSIVQHLPTDDFPRIRIGIGKPPAKMDLADFVLSRFTEEERKGVNEALEKGALAAATILVSGVEPAMNRFNGAN